MATQINVESEKQPNNFSCSLETLNLRNDSAVQDWNSFNEKCAALMADSGLAPNDSAVHDMAQEDDLKVFEDLFRENVCLLYSEVVEALNASHKISLDYVANLKTRHENLLWRTMNVLNLKMPRLACESQSRLATIKICLNSLIDSANINSEEGSKLQHFRKWLDIKTKEVNDVAVLDLARLTTQETDMRLKKHQILLTDIEQNGRFLLESAQKETKESTVSSSPQRPPTANIVSCGSSCNDVGGFIHLSNDLSPPISSERLRRNLFSLENRWTRLRFTALEWTLRLEAALKNKETLCSRNTHSPAFSEEPPVKRQRPNLAPPLPCSPNFSTPVSRSHSFISRTSRLATLVSSPIERNSPSPDVIPFHNFEYEPMTVMDDADCNGNEDHMGLTADTPDANGNFDTGLANFLTSQPFSFDNGHCYKNQNCTEAIAWSNNSSPDVERRRRIEESPVQDYYKMLPDNFDTDSDAAFVSKVRQHYNQPIEQEGYASKYAIPQRPNNADMHVTGLPTIQESKAAGMTDSLLVNLSQSKENSTSDFLVSFEDDAHRCALSTSQQLADALARRLDAKMRALFPTECAAAAGTVWRPLPANEASSGVVTRWRSKRSMEPELNSGASPAGNLMRPSTDNWYTSSNDGDSELSAEENPPCNRSGVSESSKIAVFRRLSKRRLPDCSRAPLWTSDFSRHYQDMQNVHADSSCPSFPTQLRQDRRSRVRGRRLVYHRSFLPRSVSDSEHLSILALCQRPCLHDNLKAQFNHSESQSDVLRRRENLSSTSSDGSRVNVESTDVMCYEWDDYKPPNHSEAGLLDVKMDDSMLTEFGDDYRSWIDSTPATARSDKIQPQIMNSTDADEQTNSRMNFDLSSMVRKSRSRMKLVKRALNDRPKHFNILCGRCSNEMNALKCSIYDCRAAGTAKNKEQAVFDQAEKLVREWEVLHEELAQYAKPERLNFKRTIKTLKDSLITYREKILNSSADRQQISTVEETLIRIEEFKDLRDKISSHQKNLEQLCHVESVLEYRDIRDLDSCFKEAGNNCDEELRHLEQVRDVLLEWRDNEQHFKDVSMRLKERLADCGSFDSLLDGSSSFCSTTTSSCPGSSSVCEDVKAIRCDVQKCEDRLSRLEKTCLRLAGVQSEQLNVKDELLAECRRQLAEYKRDFGVCLRRLKSNSSSAGGDRSKWPLADDNSQTDASVAAESDVYDSDCSVEKINLTPGQSPKKRRKRAMMKLARSKDVRLNNLILEPSPSLLTSRALKKAFCLSLPIPICMLLICLGLFTVQFDPVSIHNNWNWFFGFRLDYVNGPPPV